MSKLLSEQTLLRLLQQLDKNKRCWIAPLNFASAAWFVLGLTKHLNQNVLVITGSPITSELFVSNLRTLAADYKSGKCSVYIFPPIEDLANTRKLEESCDIEGDRLSTLYAITEESEPTIHKIISTSIQAVMQKLPSYDKIKESKIILTVGKEYEPEQLAQRLLTAGYSKVPQVNSKGTFAIRGGIFDLWPIQNEFPIRIEFFASTIESIRSFDPASQSSFEKHTEVNFLIRKDDADSKNENAVQSIFEYINGKKYTVLWLDVLPDDRSYRGNSQLQRYSIKMEATSYYQKEEERGVASFLLPFSILLQHIYQNRDTTNLYVGIEGNDYLMEEMVSLDFTSLYLQEDEEYSLSLKQIFSNERRKALIENLAEKARNGWRVLAYFSAKGSIARFKELHPNASFVFKEGTLIDSFLCNNLKAAVLSEKVLTGISKIRQRHYIQLKHKHFIKTQLAQKDIFDIASLEAGDLVVHIEHGIGRYLGLEVIEFNGKKQEVVTIEYADRARLYVPITQVHLLSKYVGINNRSVSLHKLGSNRWNKEKIAAEKAIQELAFSLLKTHALRQIRKGFAFPPDTEWQHSFEEAFPYEETEDQLAAINAVKADMESERPMDRLICGDVGFGKTEVALRAAFKAALAGKQIALLAPTTILAQQHYELFVERMADYPIRIELLCRLVPRLKQLETIKGIADGTVDIVIGTHALLQDGIKFKDLGLIIIDEEQRFGVAHKEKLKELKQLADVLTLTATPIPRTLYLSLVGIKEISVIQTPPKLRQPVQTIVSKFDKKVIRSAIMHELARAGQVYFLYNRVLTIEKMYETLREIVPEARIGMAHGRMPPDELANVMHSFAKGDFDVLLCTTIIQSGIDLPNVNTIIIDRADRFGMAELYQLRGRVGRSTRQAYAYLLLPSHGYLLDGARQRINALLEHSDLGAGFKLAMRDLELRGAGNILGAEQSGHINAIGFELYCQLLKKTISALKRKGESNLFEEIENEIIREDIYEVEIKLDFLAGAESELLCIPSDYIEEESIRLSIYKKLATLNNHKELLKIEENIKDRFGTIPTPFRRLLKLTKLRIAALQKNVKAIHSKENNLWIKLIKGREQNTLVYTFIGKNVDEKLEEIQAFITII